MTTIYVNTAAPPAGDGLSWATAYQTLQPALVDAGTTPGSQIWIATGSYFPGVLAGDTFTVPDQTSIYGGFAGTEAALGDRAPIPANPVYLDGTAVNNVVVSVPTGTVLLNRLNFQNAIIDLLSAQTGTLTVSDTNFSNSVNQGLLLDTITYSFDNVLISNITGSVAGSAGKFINSSGSIVNSTVENNTTTVGETLRLEGGGPHTFNNCQVRNNTAVQGGGIGAFTMSDLNINDSFIHDNTVSDRGGGIYAENGTNFSMADTEVYNNVAPGSGGGMYLLDLSGTKTFSSCNIHHNTAVSGTDGCVSGGGICIITDLVAGTGVFMSNTELAYNQAGRGGGAFIQKDFITMTTMNVHHNNAVGYFCPFGGNGGGGVSLRRSLNINITNSTFSYNDSQLSHEVNGSGGGMKIVNSLGPVFLDNLTIDHNTSTDSSGGLFIDMGTSDPLTVQNCSILNNQLITPSLASFLPLTGAGLQIQIVFSSTNATLTDCIIKNNTVDNTASDASAGAGIYVYSSSGNTLSMANLTVENNVGKTGGGLYLNSDNFGGRGAITLNNSLFKNNQALNGGGVAFNYQTCTVTNCTIIENEARYDGGGVLIRGSTINLDTTPVNKNTCKSNGGGYNIVSVFYYEDGSFGGNEASIVTIQNSEVNENVADGIGGGLCDFNPNFTPANLTLTNTEFSKNKSITEYGGGVAVLQTSSTVTNCTFSKNNSPSYGGAWAGKYIFENLTFTDVVFDKNSANTHGGGVFADNLYITNLQMTNVTFTKNTAQGGDGGGLSLITHLDPLYPETVFTVSLTGCDFDQNKAVNGGGLHSDSSNVQITDTEFQQNKALAYGGGLRSLGSASNVIFNTFTLQNVNVHDNKSTLLGGGVGTQDNTNSFTGSNIENNIGKNPGGLYIKNGLSTLTGNTIDNNSNYEIGWVSGSTIGGFTDTPNIKSYLSTNNTVNVNHVGTV